MVGTYIGLFFFFWRNHHVVFSDSQFIATFIEGECYGNVGACPCTGQCSLATALVCIVDLTSIVDLIYVCWNVTYAEELMP